MRGTDCTPDQIAHAWAFVSDRSRGMFPVDESTPVQLPALDLVRLLAWYGALRYEAGATGVGGTLDSPGPLVTVERAKAALDDETLTSVAVITQWVYVSSRCMPIVRLTERSASSMRSLLRVSLLAKLGEPRGTATEDGK